MRALRPLAGFAVLAVGLFAASLALAADLRFPDLNGRRVVDDADVLSAATEADLTRKLETLETQTRRQLVVVTLKTLQGREIEEYGYQLGRHWGIGRAGVNDGAVFIIAPNDRQVRVEVGYGLEGVLTDALSSVIINTKILPAFRAGNIEKGVIDGTDALIGQLSLPDSEARAAVANASSQARTAGAGPPWWGIFLVFMVIWGLRMMLVGSSRRPGWIFPLFVIGALTHAQRVAGRRAWDEPRRWNDRWGGGGSFGGGSGGFGGGGGSFGGGGASGRW